jgi:DNA polymerase III beta subunit
MKTIIIMEGQKNTIQGECKPREAMEILGLNPKEWKVMARNISDKSVTYTIEHLPSPALVTDHRAVPVEKVTTEATSAHNITKTQEKTNVPHKQEENITGIDTVKGEPLTGEGNTLAITTSTISVYREEFQIILQVACDIAAKKALLPILSMVKIDCAKETLTVTATDLELSYTASIPASFTDETKFLVDADVLYKEGKALSDTVDDVVITVKTDSIQINDRCTLCASVTDDFPTIEDVEGLDVSIPNLKAALASVLPAVSTDETRFMLTGVCFDLSAGHLIATDGFRLHRAEVEKADISSFVVPKRAAALLTRYGADTMIVNGKKISSCLMGGIFTSRIIEGIYPEYQNVWPDVSAYHKVSFKASEFLELIPGVLPVSDNSTIDMTINGRIDIEANSASGSYKWHVPAEGTLSGSSKLITINCRFLVDAIKAYASSETIDIAFPSGYGAIVVNEQALIMPIRR